MKFSVMIRKSIYLATVAIFCFGPGAFAQGTLSNTVNAAAVTRSSGVFMLSPLADDWNNKRKKRVAAPEGGSAALYLLLAGMACFGAMVARSRQPRTEKTL